MFYSIEIRLRSNWTSTDSRCANVRELRTEHTRWLAFYDRPNVRIVRIHASGFRDVVH